MYRQATLTEPLMVTTLGSIRIVVQTGRQEGRCRRTNRGRKGADADRRTGGNGEADRGKVRRCRQTKGADEDMQAADADIRIGENAYRG